MIPRTEREAHDLLRCRRHEAAIARRQAEHFGTLQLIERNRAAQIEAEIDSLEAAFPAADPAARALPLTSKEDR